MTKTYRAYLTLSSLSVFRGILNRSVLKSYLNLLSKSQAEPDEFLSAYGEFYSLLCERNVSGKVAYTVTQAALFDENAFTLAAAGGKADELPDSVLIATKRDCEAILALCSLTADDIINDYSHKDDISEILEKLPKFGLGEPVAEFAGGRIDLSMLADFYKHNGCGMFARYKAFVWRDGDIQPVQHPDRIDMDSFIGYERQRNKIVDNTIAFINGRTCNNCLLYGDMGTGKSSTVKAIANEFRKDGLRVVEMPKERLMDFPLLVDKIAALPMKFIIFIDDLSFQSQDKSYTSLKAVLEGGLAARPDNALIYATSNRRHIIKESWQDRDTDDIHRRDNMQETLSLSDRFGLAVCFSNPDKNEYLDIVTALARKAGITMPEDKLGIKAEQFAIGRGGRSPRCAKQFVEALLVEDSAQN
ncbi:MAG: ATP-binding protein [Ruminococcus sp.]|nr:ATP-binding protein [Ruminococcus sp.]